MTHKDLKDIIKVMKKMGVLYLKTADIEVSLSQDALITKKIKNVTKAIPSEPMIDQTSGHMGYTDEQVIFWPYVDEQEAG